MPFDYQYVSLFVWDLQAHATITNSLNTISKLELPYNTVYTSRYEHLNAHGITGTCYIV